MNVYAVMLRHSKRVVSAMQTRLPPPARYRHARRPRGASAMMPARCRARHDATRFFERRASFS